MWGWGRVMGTDPITAALPAPSGRVCTSWLSSSCLLSNGREERKMGGNTAVCPIYTVIFTCTSIFISIHFWTFLLTRDDK